MYGLPDMQRVTNIALPTAVNYCSVSPDGKKLAAVGDTNQVFIYDISNENYQKITTMQTNSDAGVMILLLLYPLFSKNSLLKNRLIFISF